MDMDMGTGGGRGGVLLLGLCALAGCSLGESVEGAGTSTPRDEARRVAVAADYVDSGTRRAWEDAGRAALGAGLFVPHTFTERIRFPDDAPFAAAYRFDLRRGQSLHLRVTDVDGNGALETELFEMISADMYRPVRSARDRAGALTYTAAWTGPHLLRVRPRAGTSGLYDVHVAGEAPITFPVALAGAGIASVFGDVRDGGARDHHGVDIFAPRGTPVVAAGGGRVTAVQHTPAGGRVIWQEDATRGVTYYYAHLEDQRVTSGQWVGAGDAIGTVGNTGNASGTRPHLHFGVYLPGTVAIDPAPMLIGSVQPSADAEAGNNGSAGGPLGAAAPLHDELLLRGGWARVTGSGVRLRSAPSTSGGVMAELRAGTPVRVVGGIADWRRVILEDGRTGFVAARYTAADPAR
ncbi:hypothetical protein BH23GEM10_BH23GEM10_04480 [soil metagenome]